MMNEDFVEIKVGIGKIEGSISRLSDSVEALKENFEQQLKGYSDTTKVQLDNCYRRIGNLENNQKWFVMTLIAESVALVISFIKILS